METLILQSLDRLLKPLRSRISNLIQSGILHHSDGTEMQVSISHGDTQDGIKQAGQFGFKSIPPASSDVLILFPSGTRAAGFCISSHSQKGCPLPLQEGETAIYSDENSWVALKQGGGIEIRNENSDLIELIYELLELIEEGLTLKFTDSHLGPCTANPLQKAKIEQRISKLKPALKSFWVKK